MNPISGYEGKYSVTEDGRVWSHPRIGRGGLMGQWIKPKTVGRGYVGVTLSNNRRYKNHSIHRLVALTYISNPNNYPEVNHKNGDKRDNRIENLEWCTKSQNMLHAYKFGFKKYVPRPGWVPPSQEDLLMRLYVFRQRANAKRRAATAMRGYLPRGLKGEKNPKAKLTELDVLLIRAMIELGERKSDIADWFGIERYYVHRIKNRTNWKHI